MSDRRTSDAELITSEITSLPDESSAAWMLKPVPSTSCPSSSSWTMLCRPWSVMYHTEYFVGDNTDVRSAAADAAATAIRGLQVYHYSTYHSLSRWQYFLTFKTQDPSLHWSLSPLWQTTPNNGRSCSFIYLLSAITAWKLLSLRCELTSQKWLVHDFSHSHHNINKCIFDVQFGGGGAVGEGAEHQAELWFATNLQQTWVLV